MSAPDGDLDRQARKHRGQLVPVFAVVLFVLVLLVFLGFWAFRDAPQGSAVQVQEGTGEVESGQANDAVSANVSSEEEQGAGSGGEADPTAVTVPSLQVEAPQTGQASDAEQNPITGRSDTAVPPDPVEGEGGEGAATEEGAAD